MTTFTEVLPVRKASQHSALNWTPVSDDFSPVAGVLVLHTDTATSGYTVTEFPTGWTGRGFTLRKLPQGSDPTEEAYSVFCNPARPLAASCTCKGHQRFDHCKHADAVASLIENGWL